MAAPPARVNPATLMLAGIERGRHLRQMAIDDKERAERRAAALRENLKRRKAQARARDVQPDVNPESREIPEQS